MSAKGLRYFNKKGVFNVDKKSFSYLHPLDFSMNEEHFSQTKEIRKGIPSVRTVKTK